VQNAGVSGGIHDWRQSGFCANAKLQTNNITVSKEAIFMIVLLLFQAVPFRRESEISLRVLSTRCPRLHTSELN
jgi:hypothetical protein